MMCLSEKERSLLLAGLATTIAIASLVICAVAGRTSATPTKAPAVARAARRGPVRKPSTGALTGLEAERPCIRRATTSDSRSQNVKPGAGGREGAT